MDSRGTDGIEVLTPDLYREHLKAVIDPEIYQNIVDLGLVYAIEVDQHNGVNVTMTLTTPQCPMGPQIIENVKQVLLEKGASRADVKIVWQPMWTPASMTVELQRELGILEDEDPLGENRTGNGTYQYTAATNLEPPEPPKKKGLLRRLFGF